MKLSRSFVKKIFVHALEEDPIECCGIIAGKDGTATKLYRAINAAASRYRYEVHSKDLIRIYSDIRKNDSDVFAIYHSHTHTEAYPSETDIRLAAEPDAYYLIVSLRYVARPELRAFRIEDKKVRNERLFVVDDTVKDES